MREKQNYYLQRNNWDWKKQIVSFSTETKKLGDKGKIGLK